MSKLGLLLIGAGGHAKSCVDVIEQENEFQIIGLVGSLKIAQILLLRSEFDSL